MTIEAPLPRNISKLAPEPVEELSIAAELPYINPKFSPAMLTGQQEKFVHYVVSGMSVGAAATAVGLAPATGTLWMKREPIIQAIEHFRAKNRDKLEFTMEEAHKMYLDVYRLAEAKEDPVAMKNVVDSLVKLHGIAAATKPQEVKITVTNQKQALRLTDEQLLEQAGLDPDHLTPVPKRRAPPPEDIVDATYTEVKKDGN